MLEAQDRTAGLCETVIEDGFTYDAAGPHIMFSKNKDVLQLMISVLGSNVHQKRRDNKIWFRGRLVKYPFENDLASLPPEDNFELHLRIPPEPAPERDADEPGQLVVHHVRQGDLREVLHSLQPQDLELRSRADRPRVRFAHPQAAARRTC